MPCPGGVWAGIGQTSLPWLQETLPRAAQASGTSSHPGDDAASSCSTLHHGKHGETLPKSTDQEQRRH